MRKSARTRHQIRAHLCDIQGRQRLVVVVEGIGGSEDPSRKHQIYLPFAHFVLLGTKAASSGKKRSLKPKGVWAIRVRLELVENHRDLAVFNMAIEIQLRGCDLCRMQVVDVMASGQIKERASVLQSKTQRRVRFEISDGTIASVAKWLEDPLMVGSQFLWPGRFLERLHISTRQYLRIVRDRVTSIRLEATACGTHSMRRTKVTQIYKKTGNLRAVQLLLGHTKMDSTVR